MGSALCSGSFRGGFVRLMVLVGLATAAGCQQTGSNGDGVQVVQQRLVGPGLDNRTWSSGQLYTRVGTIFDGSADDRGHGNVAMVNGYLATIYTTDGGGANASFAFWNVSNRRSARPRLQLLQKYQLQAARAARLRLHQRLLEQDVFHRAEHDRLPDLGLDRSDGRHPGEGRGAPRRQQLRLRRRLVAARAGPLRLRGGRPGRPVRGRHQQPDFPLGHQAR